MSSATMRHVPVWGNPNMFKLNGNCVHVRKYAVNRLMKTTMWTKMQMQCKIKEATAINGDVLKHKSSDAALTAVASNNMVAINKDQNVFDSKKEIRAAMADACEHKLTTRQKKAIALNNCLLTLYTNQDDQVHQLVAKLIQTYPDVEFKGLLIRLT